MKRKIMVIRGMITRIDSGSKMQIIQNTKNILIPIFVDEKEERLFSSVSQKDIGSEKRLKIEYVR